MKRAIIVIIVILGLCCPTDASEDMITGADLLKGCQLSIKWFDGEKLSNDDIFDATFCIGFVKGVLEMHTIIHEENKFYCMPNGVTPLQVMHILIKYLKEHPERLHQDATFLIVFGLRSVYPCGE